MNDCKNGDCGCGCCEGTEVLTPQSVANRPGLEALSYRTGTHAAFLETMKARLSNKEYPALRTLTTRQEDDPSIAMLDAGATMLDVLTFYQERIANEGYLRTATERRSVLELARLVGYKLRPGVAASVYLAFTLENGYPTEIPAGTRAQSIPAPGELPQAFETSEMLQARPEWNTLRPRMTRPSSIHPAENGCIDTDTVYFEGTATNLEPNDPLLFVFITNESENPSEIPIFCKIKSVEPQPTENRTKVILQQELPADGGSSEEPPPQPGISALTDSAAIVGEIQGVLKRHLDLTAFNVSPTSSNAQTVVGLLERLSNALEREMPLEDLIVVLDEILRQLRELYKLFEEREWNNLADWVEAVIVALEAIRISLPTDDTGSGSTDLPGDASTEKEGTTFGKVGALLNSLTKRPSQQPANAKRLTRSAKTLYGAKANTLPRFLTAFNPRLKDVLYKAWANVKVKKDSEASNPVLQSVYALRVKAAPFGHNAPQKITGIDSNGAITGYEEWTLEKISSITTESLDINISFAADGIRIIINLKGVTTRFGPRPLENGSFDIILRALNEIVKVTISNVAAPRFRIQIAFTNRPVEVGMEIDAEGRLQISSSSSDPTFVTIIGTEVDPGPSFAAIQDISEIRVSGEIHTRHSVPTENVKEVWLDASYEGILSGSWMVLERPYPSETIPKIVISQINQVNTRSRADYGITGKSTLVGTEKAWLDLEQDTFAVIRGTAVYAQSEVLILADEPILEDNSSADEVRLKPVDGKGIELDALYKGLELGRWAVVSGERTDIKDEDGNSIPGVFDSELVMLAGVEQGSDQDLPGDTPHTTVQFANDGLAYAYKRDTVKIYGNVVKATHGETRNEVLGSGDGSKSLQQFTLKQTPLTYTSAPTVSGIESSLEVRVNDVRWPEVDGLVWLAGNERGYITKTDNEDKTSIIFGDGKHGVRLPTGLENIKAVYRSGIGKPGNVAANQISLLAIKPLGVKSVINPLPATGGADRENRDQARRNVPLAVTALDRLVSIQDYADFARTFAGIGKASAVELPDGRRMLVHVTIAGAEDIPIDTNSDLFHNLRQALHQYGDPYQPVQVSVRELMLLVINAKVRILPDYQWESVEPRIRAALLKTFSFERRELGQDVMLSEVISVVQGVPGMAYVDVDKFDGIPESVAKDPAQLEAALEKLAKSNQELPKEGKQPKSYVPVNLARIDQDAKTQEDRIRAAQLAYLSPEIPETLILAEKTS